jgi:hypothetical protein
MSALQDAKPLPLTGHLTIYDALQLKNSKIQEKKNHHETASTDDNVDDQHFLLSENILITEDEVDEIRPMTGEQRTTANIKRRQFPVTSINEDNESELSKNSMGIPSNSELGW